MSYVPATSPQDNEMCILNIWQPFLRFFKRTSTNEEHESISLESSNNSGSLLQNSSASQNSAVYDGKRFSDISRFAVPETTAVGVQPPLDKTHDPEISNFTQILNPFKDFISSQMTSHITQQNDVGLYNEFLNPGQDSGLGKIQFTVGFDFQTRHLSVRIIQASHLPAMDISGTSDPYVKVYILPDKQNKVVTKVKDRKLNPKWNEIFIFENFPSDNLVSRSLYLQVMDYDRFSRDDPIGEVNFQLQHLFNGEFMERSYTMWKFLSPCKKTRGYVGEILLTICYNPQSSCLTVTTIKAIKLKAMDINKKSDPFCKIQLIESRHCRRRKERVQNPMRVLESRKTSVKAKTLNPVWNEGFVFSLPPNRLNDVEVDVSVKDKDLFSSEQIGRIRLGIYTSPEDAEHWKAMLSQPRRPISMWHVLKQ